MFPTLDSNRTNVSLTEVHHIFVLFEDLSNYLLVYRLVELPPFNSLTQNDRLLAAISLTKTCVYLSWLAKAKRRAILYRHIIIELEDEIPLSY